MTKCYHKQVYACFESRMGWFRLMFHWFCLVTRWMIFSEQTRLSMVKVSLFVLVLRGDWKKIENIITWSPPRCSKWGGKYVEKKCMLATLVVIGFPCSLICSWVGNCFFLTDCMKYGLHWLNANGNYKLLFCWNWCWIYSSRIRPLIVLVHDLDSLFSM